MCDFFQEKGDGVGRFIFWFLSDMLTPVVEKKITNVKPRAIRRFEIVIARSSAMV